MILFRLKWKQISCLSLGWNPTFLDLPDAKVDEERCLDTVYTLQVNEGLVHIGYVYLHVFTHLFHYVCVVLFSIYEVYFDNMVFLGYLHVDK